MVIRSVDVHVSTKTGFLIQKKWYFSQWNEPVRSCHAEYIIFTGYIKDCHADSPSICRYFCLESGRSKVSIVTMPTLFTLPALDNHQCCQSWHHENSWGFQWLKESLWCSQGLYSLSGQTSYRKILWSLEALRFGFKLFKSFWNLTGTSAAKLRRCLSNVKAIW